MSTPRSLPGFRAGALALLLRLPCLAAALAAPAVLQAASLPAEPPAPAPEPPAPAPAVDPFQALPALADLAEACLASPGFQAGLGQYRSCCRLADAAGVDLRDEEDQDSALARARYHALKGAEQVLGQEATRALFSRMEEMDVDLLLGEPHRNRFLAYLDDVASHLQDRVEAEIAAIHLQEAGAAAVPAQEYLHGLGAHAGIDTGTVPEAAPEPLDAAELADGALAGEWVIDALARVGDLALEAHAAGIDVNQPAAPGSDQERLAKAFWGARTNLLHAVNLELYIALGPRQTAWLGQGGSLQAFLAHRDEVNEVFRVLMAQAERDALRARAQDAGIQPGLLLALLDPVAAEPAPVLEVAPAA